MINSFTTYSKAVSKTNLEKSYTEIVKFDDEYNIFVHLHIGLIYKRIVIYANSLVGLSTNISKKLNSRVLESQKDINTEFSKIQILNPVFYRIISIAFKNNNEEESENEENEEESDDTKNENEKQKSKNGILESVKGLHKSFEKIKQIIPNFSDYNSIQKNKDLIKNEFETSIIKNYQLIIENVKNYEELQKEKNKDMKSSNNDEKIINLMLRASVTLDDLTIKIYCISADPLYNEILNDMNNNIFNTLSEINEKVLHMSCDNTIQIINDSIQIHIKFNEVIELVNDFYSNNNISFNEIIKSDNKNFQNLIDTSTAVTNFNFLINKIETRATSIEISKIISSLSSIFFDKKPFDQLITSALQLVSIFSQKLNFLTDSEIANQNLTAAFNSLSYFLKNKCIDPDTSTFGLIYTVRILAHIFSDSEVAEKILSDLYQIVSKITISFVDICKEHIGQFMSIISDNLEFFENNELNESNFYFTAINGIDRKKINTNSDYFISLQQQFYDFFCSSYRSFKQLASSCQEDQLKNSLELEIDRLFAIGINYTNWMHQFYSILYSMIHLRSKLVLDVFAFPISLLDSSLYEEELDNSDSDEYESDNEGEEEKDDGANEEEEEDKEEEEKEREREREERKKNMKLIKLITKKVTKIQKILDKTPQFLLGDISDIYYLITSIANISNHFRDFIEFVLKLSESSFYPLFHCTVTSLSEILSRKLPNQLISILSLSNFDDTNYFFCSLESSASFSLNNLTKNRDIIEKEKQVSPIFISPSFFLILSAINISEFEGNKEKSTTLKSFLSSAYNDFNKLWEKSIKYAQSNQNEETEDFSSDLNNIISSLREILKQINSQNLPSIPYNIPKPIRELKQFKRTASLIENESVIKFAQFLIQTLFSKTNINDNSHNFLKLWFNQVLSFYVEFNEQHNYNYKEINKNLLVIEDLYFKKKKFTHKSFSSFVKSLSKTSIFIAYKEDEFTNERNDLADISTLHKEIILNSKKYFESDDKSNTNQTNQNFITIYDDLCKILYCMKCSNFSKEDLFKATFSSYRNIIQIINYITKEKGKHKNKRKSKKFNFNVLYLLNKLNELSKIETSLQKCYDKQILQSENEDFISADDYIDFIVNNSEENDSNESKILFSISSKYFQIFPIQSGFLESIEKENYQNIIHNKCRLFHIFIKKYISSSKEYHEMVHDKSSIQINRLEKKKEMNDYLNDSYLYVNVSLIYFIHYIKQIDSSLQRKSEQFIRHFSEIQVNFIKLVALLNKLNSQSKSTIVLQSKNQKSALRIAKNIDSIVKQTSNFIFNQNDENVQEEEEEEGEEEENAEEENSNETEDEDETDDDDDDDETDEENGETNDDEKVICRSRIKNSSSEKKKAPKFNLIKSHLFTILIDIISDISKLNELASYSITSEMYENDQIKKSREEINENLNQNLSDLHDTFLKLEEQYSDQESNKFAHFYEIIKNSLTEFIDNTSTIKFDSNQKYFKRLLQVPSKKTGSSQTKTKIKSKQKHQQNQENDDNDDKENENENEDDANENSENEDEQKANENDKDNDDEIDEHKNDNDNDNDNNDDDDGENNESEDDNEDALDDSSFANLNKLTHLFYPQFQFFNAIISLLAEFSVTKKDPQSTLDSPNQTLASQILCNSSFPSPPNLLKSFFLAADVDPYVGYKDEWDSDAYEVFNKYFKEDDYKNPMNEDENEPKFIVVNELPSKSLYEKNIKRYSLAMKQVNDSFNELNSILGKFNDLVVEKSMPGELFLITKLLKEAADKYAQKVLQVAYFTKKNKALQVEQLIELHKFVDSVNDMQKTMQERMIKGEEVVDDVLAASMNHGAVFEATANQFRKYNRQYFTEKEEKSENNENDQNEEEEEILVLTKLNELHDTVKMMLKDINEIEFDGIEHKENQSLFEELNASMGPIMLSISTIFQRAKDLTKDRIINAKREELLKNPVVIDSKGNITRRTSIKDIDITLQNEKGLIKSAENLQNAIKKMFVCFISQDNSSAKDPHISALEYKIIVSIKSVKMAISDLITQILFIGGDPQKIMNREVKEINERLESINERAEKICNMRIEQSSTSEFHLFSVSDSDENVKKRAIPVLNYYTLNKEIQNLKEQLEKKKKNLEKFNLENP